MQKKKPTQSHSSLSCSGVTDENIRELLQPVPFRFIEKKQDYQQDLCHYTHKNLNWRVAPLIPQSFVLQMDSLYNIKYLVLSDFTHGAQMTISIAEYSNGPYVEVYKDKYICKGKQTSKQTRNVDLGALPCRAIRLTISRGVHISSKKIQLVGILSDKIEEKLGAEYFKLLVSNPQRIIFGM